MLLRSATDGHPFSCQWNYDFTFNTLEVVCVHDSLKMLFQFSQCYVHFLLCFVLYCLGKIKLFKRYICALLCDLFSPANDVEFTSSRMTSPRQWCRPSYFINSKAPVTLDSGCHTHRLLGQNPLPFIFLQPIGRRMICTLSSSFGVYSIGEHQSKTPRVAIGSYTCQWNSLSSLIGWSQRGAGSTLRLTLLLL